MDAKLVKELREKTGAGMLDCKKALAETDGDITAAVDWLREKGMSKAADKASRIAAEGTAEIIIADNKAVILEVNCETDFVANNEEFQTMVQMIGASILAASPADLDAALELSVEEQTISNLIAEKTAKIGEKLSLRRFELLEKSDEEVFGKYIHMGGKIAVLTIVKGGDEMVAKDVAMHIAAMKPKVIAEADLSEAEVTKEKEILKEQALSEGKPEAIAEKMVQGRLRKYFEEVCLLNQPFVKDTDMNVAKHLTEQGAEVVNFTRYEVGEGMEKRDENFADEVQSQMKKD